MSHQNNTGPGIETASTTTLTNTDYLIGHQASIGGGVLVGHLDSSRITWIGHSRGGEGVLRAYTRDFTGHFTPANFTVDDVQLVSSRSRNFASPGESVGGLRALKLTSGTGDARNPQTVLAVNPPGVADAFGRAVGCGRSKASASGSES
jgi:hypothetical protein